MVSLESLSKVSYSHSIVTIAVSRTVSKIQRDVGLKSRLFHTPLHSAPPLGGGVAVGTLSYCWAWKNSRVMGLPEGEKSLRNHFYSIPACDRRTDRRADGQTSCHGIIRAMHTRRAVKIAAFTYPCCRT